MRISTKGRYALRMMLDLGLHNTAKSINRISFWSSNMDSKYLLRLLTQTAPFSILLNTRSWLPNVKAGCMLTTISALPIFRIHSSGSMTVLSDVSKKSYLQMDHIVDAYISQSGQVTASMRQKIGTICHFFYVLLYKFTMASIHQKKSRIYKRWHKRFLSDIKKSIPSSICEWGRGCGVTSIQSKCSFRMNCIDW